MLALIFNPCMPLIKQSHDSALWTMPNTQGHKGTSAVGSAGPVCNPPNPRFQRWPAYQTC